MATLSNQEIEQLQQQLNEKREEIKVIYNKLVEAGAVPLSDDILDVVGGGFPLVSALNPTNHGHIATDDRVDYIE